MAKNRNSKHDTGRTITTPSSYGSHKSMVVEAPENIKLEEGQVVCKDDFGMYITKKSVLDNGLADPNRYGNNQTRL